MNRRRLARWAVAAVLLLAASLALFWPGYALYDSVRQYQQALGGRFDDWHPPIMAALWRLLIAGGGGAGPMLALQLAGWWAGLGLIAAGLAADGRTRAAAAVLAIGAVPPWLGWQVAVLKDAQMTGALLAATGLVAWWRLRARAMPWPAVLLGAVLIAYATLVRANAVFAVAPLLAMLLARRAGARLALGLGLGVSALLIAGPINHRLLGADASGVERTEAVFDLAGIAARVPDAGDLPLSAAARRAIVARHCATPYFWDPLGDESRCGGDLAELHAMPVPALYRALASAVVAHPLAYARARLSHWNSTERWLVPANWPGAAPPDANEPNAVGLAAPGRAAPLFQRLGGWLAMTPLGWPIMWTVLAVAVLARTARQEQAPARDLAVALGASALAQEASFMVLSIASDWRYHLWSTVAAALALVLVADRRPSPRLAIVTGGVLAIVFGSGMAARWLLPAAPDSYAGMLAGAGGIAL